MAKLLRTRPKVSLRRALAVLGASALFLACGSHGGDPNRANASAPAIATAQVPPRDFHAQLDGHAFPDGVLALTYDDGPDAHTLELAEYLNRQKISATFFVVGTWVPGLSSDPGQGDGVYASGVESIPVLGNLAPLGQRIANHTENHVLLWGASDATVRAQLEANQRRINPFIDDELELFRVPGGAWNGADATAIASDAALANLVGPIRWDVDRKDWEGSLSCGDSPRADCEPAAPGGAMRVKPGVMARRYLDSIESTGHGIVLFHTRLGHVGARYSVDLAEAVVPELQARGYVFAAPVLRFSAPAIRFPAEPEDTQSFDTENVSAVALGDFDGDGRADMCAADGDGVVCARSVRDVSGELSTTRFTGAVHVDLDARDGLWLVDLDGDGRADLCARSHDRTTCARAQDDGFGEPRALMFDISGGANVMFGDIDGDKKTDICASFVDGVHCTASTDKRHEANRWLADNRVESTRAAVLADVNGDGLADLCERVGNEVQCASSHGDMFLALHPWSPGAQAATGRLVAVDLNGDGKVDLCAQELSQVSCAFSRGSLLTSWTTWSDRIVGDRNITSAVASGDINGDGRSDICAATTDGIVCGVAP